MDVTYHSARRNVEKLVMADILQPIGESPRGKMFVAQEVLEAVTGPAS